MNSGLILTIMALIFMLVAVTPAEAAARPTSISSVTQGKCGWQEGWVVVFDTDEKVIVGYTSLNTDDDPFVGNLSSFWRAYWSLDFPFYHSAGFTQVRSDGSQTARSPFSAC